ncbi:cupin domain-containing protein [Patescibacteria group bacterium]
MTGLQDLMAMKIDVILDLFKNYTLPKGYQERIKRYYIFRGEDAVVSAASHESDDKHGRKKVAFNADKMPEELRIFDDLGRGSWIIPFISGMWRFRNSSCEIDPLQAFTTHFHQAMCEVWEPVEGILSVVFEGGDLVHVYAGDIIAIPLQTSHKQLNLTEKRLEYRVDGFDIPLALGETITDTKDEILDLTKINWSDYGFKKPPILAD